MRKSMRLIVVTLLLAVCNGCFPVFIEDGGRRGGGEHDRGGHGDGGSGGQGGRR